MRRWGQGIWGLRFGFGFWGFGFMVLGFWVFGFGFRVHSRVAYRFVHINIANMVSELMIWSLHHLL